MSTKSCLSCHFLFAYDALAAPHCLSQEQRNRLADEDHAVTIDKLMVFMAALFDIIRRHVASPETRKAIADEVRLLMSGVDDPH